MIALGRPRARDPGHRRRVQLRQDALGGAGARFHENALARPPHDLHWHNREASARNTSDFISLLPKDLEATSSLHLVGNESHPTKALEARPRPAWAARLTPLRRLRFVEENGSSDDAQRGHPHAQRRPR